MTALVVRADSRSLPLPDNSVDLVVTSPPYFGLRSYQDGGKHYAGQVGDEATPAEFIDALLAVTAECVRVLKPTGSIWVNLGDKYAGSQPGSYRRDTQPFDHQVGDRSHRLTAAEQRGVPNVRWGAVRPKSLIGLPWRYALRCIDDLGLILRAEVIWSKPNGLPESVTDRVRRNHEQWFHFTKEPRYYSAIDEIRLPSTTAGRTASAPARCTTLGPEVHATVRTDDGATDARGRCDLRQSEVAVVSTVTAHAQGLKVVELVGVEVGVEAPKRNLVVDLKVVGSGVPIRSLAGGATMSVSLKRSLALLGPVGAAIADSTTSPRGAVLASAGPTPSAVALRGAEATSLEVALAAGNGGAARIALSTDEGSATLYVWDTLAAHRRSLPPNSESLGKLPPSVWCIPTQPLQAPAHLGVDHFAAFPMEWPRRIIRGWSPVGGTVLDPFSGTGTTALVASTLGRTGIGVDLSHDYSRLARWRTADPGQRAAAMQVEKPKTELPGQADLFGDVA